MDGSARGYGSDRACCPRPRWRMTASPSCEFKLPNKAAADQLINQGFDLGRRSRPVALRVRSRPRSWSRREREGAARGPRLSRRRHDHDARGRRQPARRAQRDARGRDGRQGRARPAPRRRRARAPPPARSARSTPTTGRTPADAGSRSRARRRRPRSPCTTRCSYTGPQLVASWYDANGTADRLGQPVRAARHRTSRRRAYLYHVTKFRLGDASTIGTPMPAFIRIAAPNGDVAQLEVKKWVGNGAPQYAAGFQQDFITHYVDPQEGYAKITSLADRVLQHREGLRPAEQDARLPAQGADGARHRHALHGQHADPGRGRPGARGGPHLQRLGPGRRQRHHRPDRQRRAPTSR